MMGTDTGFEVRVERIRAHAEEMRKEHERRQDMLSAQAVGAFCSEHPQHCGGLVTVEGLETQCPYEGEGLCPHWEARQHHQQVRYLIGLDFPLEAASARWADLPPEIEPTLNLYCRTWEGRRKRGGGLIIAGNVGGGKTCALAMVAGRLRVRSVIYAEAQTLMRWVHEHGDELQYATHTDLLLLDDLGTEEGFPNDVADFNLLLDQRWSNRRPTIVTTNLTEESLTGGGRLARMLSRLRHRNPWLTVTRPSQRRAARVQDWAEEDAALTEAAGSTPTAGAAGETREE